MKPAISTTIWLLCAACATQQPPSAAQTSTAPVASAPAAAPPATPATQPSTSATPPAKASAAATPTAPNARCESAAVAELGYQFERVLDAKIDDIAVGTPPTIAVRVDREVRVFDGKSWKTLPALEAMPANLRYRLFFGRDNQPRLMGYTDEAEPRAYYRRFKGGRFQPEPSELGPLGSERGALYGVLGFSDPEVVCRPREICLIKRLSGWARVPAHAAPVPVFLGKGGAWALVDHTLQRLEPKAFTPFTPTQHFERPVSVWTDEGGKPWVLDAGARAVLHVAQGKWERLDLPLEQPLDLWGKTSTDVWLVGGSGAAHFDGKVVRCPKELNTPLAQLMPAGDVLWLAGPSGLFRVHTLSQEK